MEHYVRQADGSWRLEDFWGLSEPVTLRSIHCVLPLSEVYDKVRFPDESAEQEEEQ